MSRVWKYLLSIVMVVIFIGCGNRKEEVLEGESLKDKYPQLVRIAEGLIEACPVTATDDVGARDACSENLRNFSEMHLASRQLVYWGGHKEDHGSYDPTVHHLTEFDRQVWRSTYLGQFMMEGQYEIEESEEWVVLKVASRFRVGVPIGYLPYPFNHDESGEKWRAHEFSTHIYLVFHADAQDDDADGDVRELLLVAAYRYGNDTSREQRDIGPFSGLWTWLSSEGVQEPRVSMYGYVLDAHNPYRTDLEVAWTNLFNAYRDQCTGCHQPSNPAEMPLLRILNIPAQTLAAAVDGPGGESMLDELIKDTMPPGVVMAQEEWDVIAERAERYEEVAKEAIAWENARHEQAISAW